MVVPLFNVEWIGIALGANLGISDGGGLHAAILLFVLRRRFFDFLLPATYAS